MTNSALSSIATDILDILPNPVLVKNSQLEYVWINKAFEELFSVSRKDVIGKLDKKLFPNRQVSQCNGGDLRVLENGDTDEATETVFESNGATREMITRKSRLEVSDDEHYLVGVMHDITDVTRANEQLTKNEAILQLQAIELTKHATTDSLTGCFNRRKLKECEERILLDKTNTAAVVMIDVDNFKTINDNYGHDCGDIILRHLAEVVRSTLKKSDVFVRLGGEEFVVVASGDSEEAIIERANDIRQLVENSPILYDGSTRKITVSIGICFKAVGKTQSMSSALRTADRNLYEAKSTGRNRVVLAA